MLFVLLIQIWLYAFIETSNKDENRKRQIAKKIVQVDNIFISTQVINEVCVNFLRKTSVTEEEIRALILSFYNKFTIIELDTSVLLTASRLRDKYSFSFWDSIIVSTALNADCEILYSEDMQDGLKVEEKLRIINPFLIDNEKT